MLITRRRGSYGPFHQSETGRKDYGDFSNPFRTMLWSGSQPDDFYCSFKMPHRSKIIEMFGPLNSKNIGKQLETNVSAFMFIEVWKDNTAF